MDFAASERNSAAHFLRTRLLSSIFHTIARLCPSTIPSPRVRIRSLQLSAAIMRMHMLLASSRERFGSSRKSKAVEFEACAWVPVRPDVRLRDRVEFECHAFPLAASPLSLLSPYFSIEHTRTRASDHRRGVPAHSGAYRHASRMHKQRRENHPVYRDNSSGNKSQTRESKRQARESERVCKGTSQAP